MDLTSDSNIMYVCMHVLRKVQRTKRPVRIGNETSCERKSINLTSILQLCIRYAYGLWRGI